MLMPPDADPVMPASVVTVIASFTSGLGIAVSAFLITMKPGSAAITAPNPYSDAVFIEASSAPPIAFFVPSANRPITGRNANASTVTMPANNAPITAQIATTDDNCVVSGWLKPTSCVSTTGG